MLVADMKPGRMAGTYGSRMNTGTCRAARHYHGEPPVRIHRRTRHGGPIGNGFIKTNEKFIVNLITVAKQQALGR